MSCGSMPRVPAIVVRLASGACVGAQTSILPSAYLRFLDQFPAL
jgi:hypothetical protein